MNKPIRIALIGCGFFAQNHLHAWRDLKEKGAVLAAVCDVDPQKRDAAAKAFGAPGFGDVAQMLDTVKPDAVDIVTQMAGHQALCAMAAERGIAAIVQKPLAPTWSACVAIAQKARAHGTFLAVHENFRFQSPMLRVKAIIASGAIGTPNWARFSWRTGYNVYKNQPYFYDEERLVILDVGIHVLDIARVFMGEVERISCETQRRNPKVRAEDTATMLLRHVSGAVSIVESTYDTRRIPDPFPETMMEIEGDNGSIVVTRGETITVTSEGMVWEEKAGTPLLSWSSRPWHVAQESVLNTNAHMLAALQAGIKADTDIEDNLKTYALVEAAYAAAASGRAERPAM